MDRENLVNVILLALTAVCFLVPALIIPGILPFLWPDIAFIAVLLLVVTPFIWRFPMGVVDAVPEEVVTYLVRKLRGEGYVVHPAAQELIVDLGHHAGAKLYAVTRRGRTQLSCRADPTVLGWLSLLGLPGIYRRVRAWARGPASALIPADGKLPGPPAPDDVRALMLDTLSETHRIAEEAYLAERETYQNSQALLLLAGLTIWFLLFIGLSSTSLDPDLRRRWAVSAAVGLAFTLGVVGPGTWIVRRSRRGRVVHLQGWAERLQDALRRESVGSGKEVQGESSLDLLMRSHGEMPQWHDVARRASVSVDPTSWWFLFILVYFGVDLVVWQAPSAVMFSLPFGVVLGVAGVLLLAGAALYYRRWKRRRHERIARGQAEWDRRYQKLREEMEQYLGRL